jgi:hypothetical protein
VYVVSLYFAHVEKLDVFQINSGINCKITRISEHEYNAMEQHKPLTKKGKAIPVIGSGGP